MRKNVFFVVLFVTMLTIGCGKSTDATDHYVIRDKDGQCISSVTEDHSSSEDLSSNNSSSNSSEDASSETLSEINVSNEGHEPDHYGTGNFQDYWEGDDFFDIKSYALANGCTSFTYVTKDGDVVEDESKAISYILHTKDEVKIHLIDAGAVITMKDGLVYRVLTNYKTKIGEDNFAEESEAEQVYLSKKNNARLGLTALKELDVILKCIREYNYDGSELLKDSGLNYIIDSTKQHLE